MNPAHDFASPSLPVHCINLARAKDRRELMMEMWLPVFGERFSFVEAIDRRDLEAGVIPLPTSRPGKAEHVGIGRPLTGGEIACSMSHQKAIEIGLKDCSHEGFIVMEDDVLKFPGSRHPFDALHAARNDAPELDVILMCKPWNKYTSDKVTKLVHFVGNMHPYGATMVWFSREAAEEHLEVLARFTAPADYWKYFAKQGRIGTLRYPVSYHIGGDTYIGNGARASCAHRLYRP